MIANIPLVGNIKATLCQINTSKNSECLLKTQMLLFSFPFGTDSGGAENRLDPYFSGVADRDVACWRRERRCGILLTDYNN